MVTLKGKSGIHEITYLILFCILSPLLSHQLLLFFFSNVAFYFLLITNEKFSLLVTFLSALLYHCLSLSPLFLHSPSTTLLFSLSLPLYLLISFFALTSFPFIFWYFLVLLFPYRIFSKVKSDFSILSNFSFHANSKNNILNSLTRGGEAEKWFWSILVFFNK